MHRDHVEIRGERHAEEKERRGEDRALRDAPAEEGPAQRPQEPGEAEYLEAHLYPSRPEKTRRQKRQRREQPGKTRPARSGRKLAPLAPQDV